jgi:hypothetical protein
MMLKKILVTGTTIATLFLTTTANGGDSAFSESCIRTKVWDGYAEGWGTRKTIVTDLDLGETRNYMVTLYKGNEYQFKTCADEGMVNLDIHLYDLDGNEVLRDSTQDRQPMLSFKPDKTATYYVILHATELISPETNSSVGLGIIFR